MSMEVSNEQHDDLDHCEGINEEPQQSQTVDCDVVLSEMTASYTEISSQPEHRAPPRPAHLPHLPTHLQASGYVHHDGDMTHFVAEDLEYKIKLSSPITKRGETPVLGSASASRSSTPSANLYRQLLAPQIGHIDMTVLNDLEYEAQRIAQSVDNLIENLSGILHSNSSLTAANMEVYKDAVTKTCDAMDTNIKSMYTILAKGEEVSQAMIPVQAQAARITEIKRLLQIFENNL